MSWRRILLFSLVFVVALAASTWAFLQHSDAGTQWLRRELQELLAAPASLQTTSVDVAGGRFSASGLRIDDPTRLGEPLLRVESLHVDVTTNPLGPLLAVHGVVLDGVEIDLGPTLPTLESLLSEAARKPAASSGEAPTVPPVELRRGRIRFTARAGTAPLELGDLALQLTPIADAPHCAQLTGSATLRELDARVTLRGSVDFATGAVRATLALGELRLDERVLARVRELTRATLEGFDAGARVDDLTLLLSVPPRGGAPAEPTAELAARLSGVRVVVPDLPGLVRSASVTLHASTAGGGTVRGKLEQDTAGGRIEVSVEATQALADPQIDVRAAGRGIRIDDDVRAALGTFDVGRDVLEALRPTAGRADLDLYLQNPQRRSGLAELDLLLNDVAMSYHGFGHGEDRASFPLPLVDARGRVRLRDDVVLIDGVRASIDPAAGGGTVRLDGRVDTRRAGGDDATLDIHAENVEFNPHLRTALTALLDDEGELYDKFSPTGRSAVTVLVRPRRQLPGGWSVEVRPNGARMAWAGFPYRLDDLRGSVSARDDGVRFDLVGKHGGAVLTMRGRIPVGSGPEANGTGFEAVIGLENVAPDDDLRRAVAVMAPEIDAPWIEAAPTGRFGGEVKVWRPTRDDALHHDVRLDLHGVGIRLPVAPWRAAELRGQLFVQGSGSTTRVDFDALRGTLDHGAGKPAQLAMLGSLATGESTRDELAFVVRDLELDDQLGKSLESLGALGRGTWSSLLPSGTVDLVCHHQRDAAGKDELRLVVQLVDVSSNAPILPRPARHMTGELTVAGGELAFTDVRAELGGALVRCSDGRVATRPDGRTSIRFRAQANGMPVDDGMANLFAGPLRQAVLDRHLAGRADIDELVLAFAIPDETSKLPFETTIAGQLRLYDVEMSLGQGSDGIRVQGIGGVVTLDESVVSDAGGGLAGRLQNGSLRIFGQPFENVETSFTADAERIVLPAMTSRFHNGSVRAARVDAPALLYLLPAPATPEGRLSAELAFERVDVYSFLDTTGWTNPPYSGLASGRISLAHLDGNRVVAAEGSGELTITRADLGVVPLFTAIYAQLPASDRPRFSHLETTFRLDDRRLTFDELDVRSNLLGAKGAGTLDLDGYLDVRMKLDNLLGTSADPLVMPLIDYLTSNIVRFHLFGHLRDLRAEKRWFGEASPSRRQVVPMPPAAPRVPLPDF